METELKTKPSGWKKTAIICATILLLGVLVTYIIFNTVPVAQREGAVKQTAMLVDVSGVEVGTFRPVIKAMGTVVPSKDIMLSPLVDGEIVALSESFTPGGFVKKGETLLKIAPEDYQNNLRQVEANWKIELGQQNIAEKEYEMLKENLSGDMHELVLREPQLKAARAAYEQAKLELERTHITAPFDAHIINRNVNVGSQVALGDNLGRLVGYNTYWVEATVAMSKLQWLKFNTDTTNASTVKIRNRTAWAKDVYRIGKLDKLIGALEERTRLARVLITIDNPLALDTQSVANSPRLMIGSFVEAGIEAKELKDVIRIKRDYLRSNDTVWVMANKALSIKHVDIILRDETYAYIRSGLDKNDQVVITNLSTVVEGSPLRLNTTKNTSESNMHDEIP